MHTVHTSSWWMLSWKCVLTVYRNAKRKVFS